MKRLSIILILLFSTTLLFGQSRQVYDQLRSDVALDEYRTYAIGNAFVGAENEVWIKHSSSIHNMVKNSIVYEFDTYGYELDEENGELVVSFMVFDEAYSDKIGFMPGYRIEDNIGVDDNILTKINDGTLVISIVDASEGVALWTGFVTDAIDKNADMREQQKGIRQSVNAAMELFITRTNFDANPITRFEMMTETGADIAPDDSMQ